MANLLQRYEKVKLFSDREAWLLFRLAAWAEAAGWTLLIAGLLLKHFVFKGNDAPVLIAGQIHGTFFLIYLAACTVLYPSLGWSRWKATLAVAASVPPYGSLAFEQWCAYRRSHARQQTLRSLALYQVLTA